MILFTGWKKLCKHLILCRRRHLLTFSMCYNYYTARRNFVSDLASLYSKLTFSQFLKEFLARRNFVSDLASLYSKLTFSQFFKEFLARRNFVSDLAPLIKATFSCFYSAESPCKTCHRRLLHGVLFNVISLS